MAQKLDFQDRLGLAGRNGDLVPPVTVIINVIYTASPHLAVVINIA